MVCLMNIHWIYFALLAGEGTSAGGMARATLTSMATGLDRLNSIFVAGSPWGTSTRFYDVTFTRGSVSVPPGVAETSAQR